MNVESAPMWNIMRQTVITFFSLLLRSDCYHAYCPRPPRLVHRQNRIQQYVERDRIRLHQVGPDSSGDYLSNLSANNGQNDSENEAQIKGTTDKHAGAGRRKSRMANVKSALSSVSSEVERRTSEVTSGFASFTERGSSDLQSLANNAKSSVKNVAKKGTRDLKRTALSAQRAVKRTAGGLANTGQGLSDMHFFEVARFSPKIDAEEIVRWIDAQAKSGTEMARSGTEIVGSKAKTLVLNFTGKKEYRFGDVTKELMHRVASQEVNMQDTILLLKILLALGATVGPLAELLPFTILIEALNLSLEQKVGGKVLEVLSKTLDSRLVASLFTADDKNLIGDVVKRTVLGGVLEFTGKSSYEPGDIQRAVQRGQEDDDTDDVMKLDLDISSEFEEWDRLFVEKIETEEYMGSQAKIMDMKIAMALEECETLSQRKDGVVS